MLRIYAQFKVISKGDTKIELIRFLFENRIHPEKISSDFFKKCVTIRQVDYIPCPNKIIISYCAMGTRTVSIYSQLA